MAYEFRELTDPEAKPFDVNAKVEDTVFNALRKGETSPFVNEAMASHLVRCAVKGLDIANRKDTFKRVK